MMKTKEAEKVGLFGSIRNFFKFYATFRGKSSRSEYWYLWVASIAVNALLFPVFWLVAEADPQGQSVLSQVFLIALSLGGLALVLPTLAIMARRLRDAGLSPYLLFLLLAPAGGLAIWIMMMLPSKELPPPSRAV